MGRFTRIFSAKFWTVLGPGILFASTAIGVSHLVQSTRAGAAYGFLLVPFILLANLLKYPFFEIGSRYANVKGQHILHGYMEQGRWVLILYLLLTICTMFTVCGAVTLVCAGLLGHLLGISLEIYQIAGIILVICMFILGVGKFHLLDGILKVIAVFLLLSTLSAFVLVLLKGRSPMVSGFEPTPLWERGSLLFVAALMGWMPTAIDLSSWNSIWTLERIKQTKYHPSLKETLLDFNVGYGISAVLSICFVTLGAYLVFGTGQVLSDKAIVFSGQLVDLYTITIGQWCYVIIAVAAFSTMFSTTITVIDGYGRSLKETVLLLSNQKSNKFYYQLFMILVCIGSFVLIYLFSSSLRFFVDLATTLSFLIAPIVAVINYRLVFKKDFPSHKRPSIVLKYLAISGIVFLTLLALGYVVMFFV